MHRNAASERTQERTRHHGDRGEDCDLTAGACVGGLAVTDRETHRGHAHRHDEHEASSKAHTCLFGQGILPVGQISGAVLGQCEESCVKVGPTNLVGDEQRLASRIGGGVSESLLQMLDGVGEVCGEEPLPMRRGERFGQFGGGSTASIKERLRHRAAD